MQIVIDTMHCPCRTLNDECSISERECYEDDICSLCPLIMNGGVKLPKGHGRLIDADALEKDMVNGIRPGLYEEGYETFAHINDMDDCIECIKYADTIIEADMAESEE